MKIKKTQNLITLAEAAKISGMTQGHLNFLSRTGKLQAQKLGRNWYTTMEWVASLGKENKLEEGSLITLAEASKISGYTRGHLNLLAMSMDFNAKKIGRNWYTTKDSLKRLVEIKKIEKEE